jgi:hypothetical protein
VVGAGDAGLFLEDLLPLIGALGEDRVDEFIQNWLDDRFELYG